MSDTAGLLATVVAAARRVVEVRQQREPFADLERRAEAQAGSAGRFKAAVRRADAMNVIAECKRRSPSRGVLRAKYDPVGIARSYEGAGAAAVSVLTEPTFFDGSLTDLEGVSRAVGLPVLRKDFVVSEYQVLEAKAAGASAVLLIVAALERHALTHLIERAATFGLNALVEVHDSDELAQALDAGADIIGVNNRNLRTLEVDVRASETLIGGIPREVVAISESGLRAPVDLLRLRDLGYLAFLIGEQFMTADDPGSELRRLLRGCTTALDTGAQR